MACDLELGLQWEALRQIKRNVDAQKRVSVREELHLALQLLPLLDDADMKKLVREELQQRGWTETPDGGLEKHLEGGALARLSPEGDAVTLSLDAEETLRARVKLKLRPSDDLKAAETQAKREAKAQVEEASSEAKTKLNRQVTERLSALEPELRAEIQRALNQTYRRALEIRAKQIGELESVQERQEDNGSYEVTLVVKA